MIPRTRALRVGATSLGLAVALFVGAGIAVTHAVPQQPASPAGARGAVGAVPQSASGGDLEVAVASLQERLRRLPGDYAAWAALGGAYVQQARLTGDPAFYDRAEGALTTSLDVRPEANDAALTGLSSLAAARHDFAAALDHAHRAQEINPYSALNQGALTDALIELGRYDEAFEELQRMVDLRPGVPSLTRVSYAWELRGETALAEEALQRALGIAATPADASYALFYLGELAWNSGDLDAAARHYTDGLRRDPTYVPLVAGNAKVAAARGDVQAALAGYAQVVQRAPQPGYLIEYADLLASLGRTDDAEEQYAVVDATRSLFEAAGVDVDLEIALYDADRGRAEQALTAAETEWRKRRSVHTEDAYAWALHVSGRDREALEHARAAQALGTRSALFDYHRGMIEASLGLDVEATASLRRALGTNPYFSPFHADRASQVLAELEQQS